MFLFSRQGNYRFNKKYMGESLWIKNLRGLGLLLLQLDEYILEMPALLFILFFWLAVPVERLFSG